MVRRDEEMGCDRGGEVDKIDNESVESSNCDSLRMENSSSDDIGVITMNVSVLRAELLGWFVQIARILLK